jgi:hypothetical protein
VHQRCCNSRCDPLFFCTAVTGSTVTTLNPQRESAEGGSMGKLCLAVVSGYPQRLIGGAVLLSVLAGVPARAASNQATAILRIQVTVVPTVQAANTHAPAGNASAPITYDLQPSSTPRMTSQVTIHQISTTGTTSSLKAAGQSATGAVLQTTTIVPE